MKRSLPMIRAFALGAVAMLVPISPVVAQGEPFDHLELTFRPLWAKVDDASETWENPGDRDPGRVFYLYENRDLARIAVTLSNLSGRTIPLSSDGPEWLDQIELELYRDGVRAEDVVSLVLRKRVVETIAYRLDGQLLDTVVYEWRDGRYFITSEYDVSETVREEVASFPREVAPFGRLVAYFDLESSRSGSDLAPGEYRFDADLDVGGFGLTLRPYQPTVLAAGPVWLVTSTPQTEREQVQSELIRASFLWENGDLGGAVALLERTHGRWPDSLKALDHLASYAYEAGRLELAVGTLEQLRRSAERPELFEFQRSIEHTYDLEEIDGTLEVWRGELGQ